MESPEASPKINKSPLRSIETKLTFEKRESIATFSSGTKSLTKKGSPKKANHMENLDLLMN